MVRPKNRDELLELIRDSRQNDLIDEDTARNARRVMDIADQRSRYHDPRSQMITLKRNQSLDECLDVIIESAHSRFPVISEEQRSHRRDLMARSAAVYAQRCQKPSAWKKCYARPWLCRKVNVWIGC